jgi:hypothetical protein
MMQITVSSINLNIRYILAVVQGQIPLSITRSVFCTGGVISAFPSTQFAISKMLVLLAKSLKKEGNPALIALVNVLFNQSGIVDYISKRFHDFGTALFSLLPKVGGFILEQQLYKLPSVVLLSGIAYVLSRVAVQPFTITWGPISIQLGEFIFKYGLIFNSIHNNFCWFRLDTAEYLAFLQEK